MLQFAMEIQEQCEGYEGISATINCISDWDEPPTNRTENNLEQLRPREKPTENFVCAQQ